MPILAIALGNATQERNDPQNPHKLTLCRSGRPICYDHEAIANVLRHRVMFHA